MKKIIILVVLFIAGLSGVSAQTEIMQEIADLISYGPSVARQSEFITLGLDKINPNDSGSINGTCADYAILFAERTGALVIVGTGNAPYYKAGVYRLISIDWDSTDSEWFGTSTTINGKLDMLGDSGVHAVLEFVRDLNAEEMVNNTIVGHVWNSLNGVQIDVQMYDINN
jgi:hypothetical protein